MRSACTLEDPTVTSWQRLEIHCVHAIRGLRALPEDARDGCPSHELPGSDDIVVLPTAPGRAARNSGDVRARLPDVPPWFKPSIAHQIGKALIRIAPYRFENLRIQ
jgi:hypothetical protein